MYANKTVTHFYGGLPVNEETKALKEKGAEMYIHHQQSFI